MSKSERPDAIRRQLAVSLCLAGIAPVVVLPRALAQSVPIDVWTGPSCSCCHDWVAHLRDNGFAVTVHDGGNSDARERLGMPVRYGSCHTAEVGGYAIEGHVPAVEVQRLLAEKLSAIGLAVPAMPRGSPGMDGPVYRGVKDPYDVLLIRRNGSAVVFQSYRD